MNLVACMPLGVDTVSKIMSAMESSETFPVLGLGYALSDRKGRMVDLAAAADSGAKADVLATAVGMEVEEVLDIYQRLEV